MRTAFLCLVLSCTAEAQCPAMPGASESLAERSPEERTAFILERTRAVEDPARIWSATFALGYLGASVVQLGVLTSSNDPGRRIDMAIGAASSLIGVASIVALPVRVLVDRERIETLAPLAAAGDCDALASMERILAEDAGSEEFGTSWLMHIGSILFNVALGLFQGLGWARWESAGIATAIGIGIGELQILTKPRGMVQALAHYRSGDLDSPVASGVQFAFNGTSLELRFQ